MIRHRRVVGMILLLLAAGCGGPGRNERLPEEGRAYPPAYGDSIVEGMISDPAVLNPVLASDSASFEVIGLLFNSLLKYDKDLNLVGELASSWDISNNGTVITFELRPGIKWQDGEPLTSADVQFTLDTYRDPKTRTAYASNYENIVRSEAVDDLTFKVWYRKPFAPALERLGGMPILPRHLLQGIDINQADAFANHPIGSGPYRFVSWKRAETVVLEANPEYFEGRPYLNRVIYRIIPDTAVQFLELQNNGLDIMELTPNQYHGEAAEPEFTARFNKYRYPSNQYTYLGFNLKHPLFRDAAFRQAIALAIDTQALVKSVLEGLGQPATGPFTPSSWAYNPDVPVQPYDPLRARELFLQAGCRYGKDGVLLKDGKPVAFTLLTNQGNRNREQTATIIQSQLKDVGIDVQIRVIAWSVFLEDFINKRKFDAVIMGWALARDPDVYSIWHSSQTGEQQFNFVGYRNPEVDRLLEEGRATFNQERRTAIYHQVHAKIAADLPYVFLYVPDALPAVHRRIVGIQPAPAGIAYNFMHWYVPKEFQRYTP